MPTHIILGKISIWKVHYSLQEFVILGEKNFPFYLKHPFGSFDCVWNSILQTPDFKNTINPGCSFELESDK